MSNVTKRNHCVRPFLDFCYQFIGKRRLSGLIDRRAFPATAADRRAGLFFDRVNQHSSHPVLLTLGSRRPGVVQTGGQDLLGSLTELKKSLPFQ